MEEDIKAGSLKKDLTTVPLVVYFIAYFLYLFFNKYLKLEDEALLFKPIIIPCIAFVYFFTANSKKTILNLFLFSAIFFADNVILLKDRKIYEIATLMYVVVLFILFYYVVNDSEIVKKYKKNNSVFGRVLAIILGILIALKVFNFGFKLFKSEVYFVIIYVFVLLTVFLLSIYNAFKKKSLSAKFLLAMLASLVMSDVCLAINEYYFNNPILVFIGCCIEIPVYYFLLRFLLEREKYPSKG